MKKFLITLFIFILSPLFLIKGGLANEPEKSPIVIDISPQTNTSLINIKNDFKTDIYDYICQSSNQTSDVKLKNQITSCTPNTTIKDLYNCVCNDTTQLNGKISPIINFTGLKTDDTLSNQFKQINEFYNALDSIILIVDIKNEIQTTLNALEEATNAQIQSLKEEIKNKINSLNSLLNEEHTLRNNEELKTILQNLNLDKHLENIETEMTKSNADFNKILNTKYSNLPNNTDELNKILKELEKEEKTATSNIEKLNNALQKNKEAQIKAKKDALLKAKQDEARILKEIIDIVSPSISPLTKEIKDGNDVSENAALNSKLYRLDIKPNFIFNKHKTIEEKDNPKLLEEFTTETENTLKNIDLLKELKDDLKERNDIKNNLSVCSNNIDEITERLNISSLLNNGIPPKHNKYPNGYVYLTQSSIEQNCATKERPVFYIEKGSSFNCSTSKFLYPTEIEYLKGFSSSKCKTCETPQIMSIEEANEKQQICYDNLELLKLLENIMNNCKDNNNKYLIEPSKAITTYKSLEDIEKFCKDKKAELEKLTQNKIDDELSNIKNICCNGSSFTKYCEEEGALKNGNISKLRTIKASELPTLTTFIQSNDLKKASCDKIDSLYNDLKPIMNINSASNCEAKRNAISQLTNHNLSQKSYKYYQLKFSVCE